MKKEVKFKLNTVIEVEALPEMDDADIIRVAKEQLDDPYGKTFWGDLIETKILD